MWRRNLCAVVLGAGIVVAVAWGAEPVSPRDGQRYDPLNPYLVWSGDRPTIVNVGRSPEQYPEGAFKRGSRFYAGKDEVPEDHILR